MSDTIKATRLQICIFVQDDKVYDDQSPAAQAMFDVFAQNVIAIQELHSDRAPIELDFCPMAYNENAVIVAKQHLDPSRLPAAQVTALYPDGTRRQYFLKTGLGGIDFTAASVKPYITALLYDRRNAPLPIICKILPPLCNLGMWFWLAATIYAGYRTTQARNVGKVAWGGVALLSGEAFVKGGGITQIQNMIKR